MKKILIINTHHPYPSSGGALNAALTDLARAHLENIGNEVKVTRIVDGYNARAEADKHAWADVVIVQGPVNWMSFPWSYKKYQDEVYGAMSGIFYDGDGRHSDDRSRHYGSGGMDLGKKYMLSLTYNAPREAFDDEKQFLLQGKGVDDMFLPSHAAFRFMGMEALETFVCYDVHKNPDIENDFVRYRAHLDRLFD